MELILPVIVVMPLLGALISGMFGRILPKWVVGFTAVLAILGPCFGAVTLFQAIQKMPPAYRVVEYTLYQWISAGFLQVPFALRVDQLSISMLLMITFVSTLIHVYSLWYMKDDPGFKRFMAYLNLFVFFMLLLIMSPNLVLMFVGWEGVGLCSYLLIGFWYREDKNALAGLKAFVVNRIGDFGFILAMLMLFCFYQTLDIVTLSQRVATFAYPVGAGIFTLIVLALVLAVSGKSAQLPLYVWLPDAMAGPTPVSALIHAATMVTAGVYLLVRMSFLIQGSETAMAIILIIGTVTALLTAIIALYQTDIKRILAYSTISQLGYMVMAVGAGAMTAAIFHLLTHAFFKALLFLSAGVVMTALHHEGDVFKMGGLWKKLPVTFVTALIAVLAIVGVAPLSGFASKDEILYQLFIAPSPIWPMLTKICWLSAEFTVLLTSLYMGRWLMLVFLGKYRGHHHPKEDNITPLLVLLILAFGSALMGLVNWPKAFGGQELLHHFLQPVFGSHLPEIIHHSADLPWRLAGISVGTGLIGLFLAFYYFVLREQTKPIESHGIIKLIKNKFMIDELYNVLICQPLFWVALTFKAFDALIIDGFVNGSAQLCGQFSGFAARLQTRLTRDYALIMVMAILLAGLIVAYY